jgi:drug/metabolite transporter (DMT)-like permease
MYSNYRVLLAYMVTFINIFIWIFALRVVSLSTATVLASSNYVLIVFVDKIFFNEEIKARNLIGAILISLGVLIDAVYN